MALTDEQVIAALRTVQDPELFKDIVTLGMVKRARVDGTSVSVTLELNSPARDKVMADVRSAMIRAGAEEVEVELTADARGGQGVGGPGGGGGGGPAAGVGSQARSAGALPQVQNIVAVGAGKGGVGKSTIAVNLAVGLARTGAAVGIMDGDIYGPSLPTLLGLKGKQQAAHGQKLIPFHVHGVHAMTLGALVEEEKPLIWRGPMAHGAFKNLLLDYPVWPELDYLIIDLPPGTGDVPLTLTQLLPLTGAVVVATPQQVALDDATRAVRMFQQLQVPILGVVENMSYFVAPDGSEHDVFGRGGTERAAQRMGTPYLGALPMFTDLRVNSDAGNPTANFEGDPRLRAALENLVQALHGQVNVRNMVPRGPELTIT